uniref:N/A n=1 Tax=Ganoderma boninense TaxID=34458 RepID=A0A5K1K1Z5_9APHY|nr:N/A [Ganoderma boninense]
MKGVSLDPDCFISNYGRKPSQQTRRRILDSALTDRNDIHLHLNSVHVTPPLLHHLLDLPLHIEPPENAPEGPVREGHPPGYVLGQDALRGRSEHAHLSVQILPDRPAGPDQALVPEPRLPELHRAPEEDEVRGPEAVPSTELALPPVLADGVKRLSGSARREKARWGETLRLHAWNSEMWD